MKKVLIICGGWDGHQPVEGAQFWKSELEQEGLEVEISDSLDSLLNEENINSKDIIIPNWTMGQITGEQSGALAKAVKSGIGLAGFHGGMGDAFRRDTEFQFIVGGQFVSHPDNGKDYTVTITKPDNPIVAGIEDFQYHSEQYYMHVDPSNEVLAETTFQTGSAPWVNGCVMPVVWKRVYGAGRVFYSSLGHQVAEWTHYPSAKEIQKRGILWAAGIIN